MSRHGTIVPPHGPVPSAVLLVGERPGFDECRKLRPFVGKSGAEQKAYLARYGVSPDKWRMTNVCPEYDEHNDDPSPAMLEKWLPELEREVKRTSPKIIAAVGRFAMRAFLGDEAELDTCWGLPHNGGAFDPSVAHRANGAIVVPIIHPAAGFYDGDARAPINEGYRRLAEIVKAVNRGDKIEIRHDPYAGKEQYLDATGKQLAHALRNTTSSDILALDTEGTERHPWSVQVSLAPGTAYCLRTSQSDFKVGINAIAKYSQRGGLVVMHNALYDVAMCYSMGLDLTTARLWDTMTAAYLLRLEPQGLKALAWRHCAVKMTSYQETVGDAARSKQIKYLLSILSRERASSWGTPEPRAVFDNSGKARLYKPQSIKRRVEKILVDALSDDAVDVLERWRAVDDELRDQVVRELGDMPTATLADIPLQRAINYAAKDADVTRRLYFKLNELLSDRPHLVADCMNVLPAFAEMQITGLPVSRRALEQLRDDMTAGMKQLQRKISREYFSGKPFNPKSPKDVGKLLLRRGLEPAKRTATGAVSTGKQSIEHLRYEDEAIADVIEWREHQHTKDMFAVPTLALLDDSDDDIVIVRPYIKTTRTHTRRLATADPNVLAFSKHEKPGGKNYGDMLRNCFVCDEGEVFCETDLSQIEIRLLAHESGDPLLCKAYAEDRDIHRETAAFVFGVKQEDVKPIQRFLAKRVTFGCVPLSSKALTDKGWQSHRNVNVGDRVMGYDPSDKTLKWTRVLDKVYYDDAPIVELKHELWRTVSTPNHRWYGSQRRLRNGKRSYEECELTTETINNDSKVHVSALFDNAEQQFDISRDEACIIGWLFGDGSVVRSEFVGARSQAGGRRVKLIARIHQSKPAGVKALQRLLRDVPHTVRKNSEGKYGFHLKSDYSRDLFSRAQLDDYMWPQWVMRLSSEQRRGFLAGVFGAEGHYDQWGHRIITQNEGDFLEGIQLAVFLQGHRASKCVNDLRGNFVSHKLRYCAPDITGQTLKRKELGRTRVWCIKTELGSWVMRQGDLFTITGNTAYGMSGQALATQLRMAPPPDDGEKPDWGDRECNQFIVEWKKLYKGAAAYIERTAAETSRTGMVEDCWGMRRYLPAVWADDKKLASEAARQAVNHKIQGGAQGLLQRGLIWLYPHVKRMQREGLNVRLLLTIHDSLLLRMDEELYDEVSALVIEALTKHNGLNMRVPVTAESKKARSWGEL